MNNLNSILTYSYLITPEEAFYERRFTDIV